MKIVAILTDTDGNTGQRVENLCWFLNLVSSYLKGGAVISVTVPGGAKIEVQKLTSVPATILKSTRAVSRAINESDRKRAD